ncbi:UNVERIFIED_CONTAM: hypothetical protein Cloal_2299 [Acetivibrio alkalicellulosi]
MSYNHEKIQEKLMDVFYKEGELTKELKSHIDDCSECNSFWRDLNTIEENIPSFDLNIEVDERVIGGAFRKVGILKEKRKNIKDLALFATIASIILGCVGLLANMGYGKSIILVQIFLVIFAPLSIPFMIRQRLVKEES